LQSDRDQAGRLLQALKLADGRQSLVENAAAQLSKLVDAISGGSVQLVDGAL
jgi:hypothetical protein